MEKLRAEGDPSLQGFNKTLDERPKILPTAKWVWEVFVTLDAARPLGFNGPLPIPLGEIVAYCELMGIRDIETREDLFNFIRVLDPISLEDFYRKQKSESKKK